MIVNIPICKCSRILIKLTEFTRHLLSLQLVLACVHVWDLVYYNIVIIISSFACKDYVS